MQNVHVFSLISISCYMFDYSSANVTASLYKKHNKHFCFNVLMQGPTDVQVAEDEGPVEIELVSTVPITCATCDIAGGFENRCL